jgi:hypothetical protein
MIYQGKLPDCYGTGPADECVLDCPCHEDCAADSHDVWDEEHCPYCGSDCIEMLGTTCGEDIGDQSTDLERWTCCVCMEDWTTDLAEAEDGERR